MFAKIKYFVALAVLSQAVTAQDPSLFCLDQVRVYRFFRVVL